MSINLNFPALITAARENETLQDVFLQCRSDIERYMSTVGGVLFRGFKVASIADFREFAGQFGHALLSYQFGSTPRTEVSGGVYTSTEYPAHQAIPLHNEQAYTREWPLRIWFHCVVAAAQGGQTPIADSRKIYRRIPSRLREIFTPGLLYVRNYGDFDLPWQKVFNTHDRGEVEAFCRRSDIRCEWKADGGLRTTQHCQAIEAHPVSGELVWFNQAHIFHVSSLMAEVRESLEDILGLENMPRNVYLADGASISDAMIEDIRSVLEEEAVSFPWVRGDVLMLDNMLVAHARAPFKGERKVVVAMAQPHGNLGSM